MLAVGGWPDKAFEPSGWEWRFEAEPLSDAGRHEEALAIMQDSLDQFGESGAGLYHVARYEARAGRAADATAHIARALELNPEFRRVRGEGRGPRPLAARRPRGVVGPAASARKRRHRVGFRPRYDEQRAVRLDAERLYEQLQPGCQGERLVGLITAEGNEILLGGDPGDDISLGHLAHRDVGHERPAVRRRHADGERRRAHEWLTAVGVREPGRGGRGQRRGQPSVGQ